ncbi:hypothetical protein M501DRAFT_1057203 [Patellaria atrata CBS 101060]|uniref:Uncharacterized protein n=1 Tax=Patellaria atrata CBS 101060 TaxID=1346257 RepID=A0A9P4SDQ5_9PEZI|nr:hypothetical protein M501DRAFT_1057203 [Patellaria atrata CBS 101060]
MAGYPPLTTLFVPPSDCARIWRYAGEGETDIFGYSRGTRLYKDITAPSDNIIPCESCFDRCKPSGWTYPPASFSPGICPFGYVTVDTKTDGESSTDAACCPEGLTFTSASIGSAPATWFCGGNFFTSTAIDRIGLEQVSRPTGYSYPLVHTTVGPGTKFAWPIFVAWHDNELSSLEEAAQAGLDAVASSTSATSFSLTTTETGSSNMPTDSSTLVLTSGSPADITPGRTAQTVPQTSTSNPDAGSSSSSLTAGEIAAIPISVSAAIFLAGIAVYVLRRRRRNDSSGKLGGAELDASNSHPREIDAVEPGSREMEAVGSSRWEAGGKALFELEAPVQRSELEGEKLSRPELR